MDKVTVLSDYKGQAQRQAIDQLCAEAFVFLRDGARQEELPFKQVISEHLLGLSQIMAAVEGRDSARTTLQDIIEQLRR
ncbi:MAG: hypothetical protein ACI9WS_000194 [Paraglaciecola psychrophila]|jgi:hypothetical protein